MVDSNPRTHKPGVADAPAPGSRRHPLRTLRRDYLLYRDLFSGYIWRHRLLFTAAVGCMLCAALTNLLLASLVKPLTDEVAATSVEVGTSLLPVLIIGAILLRALLTSLGDGSAQSVSQRLTRDLRSDLYTKLLHLPIGYFDRTHSGSLIARFTNETSLINRSVSDIIVILFKDIPTLIFLIAFMIYRNWLFAIVALLCAPAMTYTLLKFKVLLRQAHREVQNLTGEMISVADDALTAARVVRIYGGQQTEQDRFGAVIRNHYRSSVRALRATLLSRFLLQTMLCMPILALIILVVTYGHSSLGDLLSFLVVFLMLIQPVRKLSMINASLQQVLAALESVHELKQLSVEPDSGTVTAHKIRGTIDVSGVCFSYPSRTDAALTDLHLHIAAGETVALVGASGSGKSTLINLMCRFYEADKGHIQLDDRDIHEYTLRSYRRQLAVVGQEVLLFNDSIRNNIAYGGGAAHDEVALQQVIQDARIDEFLPRLPQGLHSSVGEGGMLLSGGQRQRIAIARALLKNAPVLILDEATSSLDPASERYVEQALHNARRRRTCIIIAHRAATVERAPRILVLEKGRLAGDGTHGQLLTECPEYVRLFTQLQGLHSPQPG